MFQSLLNQNHADLIRLGRKGDGGYIVSKLDLEKIILY